MLDEILRLVRKIASRLNRSGSPWLEGVPQAAMYAAMNEGEMRKLVKSGAVESHLKPEREDGTRPRGILIYAPSIDALLMQQPSGACEAAKAMRNA